MYRRKLVFKYVVFYFFIDNFKIHNACFSVLFKIKYRLNE